MAGIFGIFNDSTNVTSGSLNRIKEKTFAGGSSKFKSAENGVLPSKVPSQVKPKGLSMRSKSALNISVSNSFMGSNKLKSKECLKPQEKLVSFNKHSLSPFKMKTPKSKSIASITPKKLSPKISSPIMQNVVDDHVFKKPATPVTLKKHHEPEKLAYDFDDYKFMNEQMQNFFIDEQMFFNAARKCGSLNESTMSFEDEGFISDPELDSSQDQSLSSCLNDVPLPDLSDFED